MKRSLIKASEIAQQIAKEHIEARQKSYEKEALQSLINYDAEEALKELIGVIDKYDLVSFISNSDFAEKVSYGKKVLRRD